MYNFTNQMIEQRVQQQHLIWQTNWEMVEVLNNQKHNQIFMLGFQPTFLKERG